MVGAPSKRHLRGARSHLVCELGQACWTSIGHRDRLRRSELRVARLSSAPDRAGKARQLGASVRKWREKIGGNSLIFR